VKDENGHFLADTHNTLNRWKNYFSAIGCITVSAIRQMEIHTTEPLGPDPNPSEVETATAK
jgi:hypothetical protein